MDEINRVGETSITTGRYTRHHYEFSLSAVRFWKALSWTLPLDEQRPGKLSPETARDVSCILSWQPMGSRPHLYCFWRDAIRGSFVSIPVHSSTLPPSWIMKLQISQLRMLGDILHMLYVQGYFEPIPEKVISLLYEAHPAQLYIAYERSAEHRAMLVLPGFALDSASTISLLPATVPTMLGSVRHTRLADGVALLQTQMLTSVDLYFKKTDDGACLVLSNGRVYQPMVYSIPLQKTTLPPHKELHFTIDCKFLLHIIKVAQGLNIDSWQITLASSERMLRFTVSSENANECYAGGWWQEVSLKTML